MPISAGIPAAWGQRVRILFAGLITAATVLFVAPGGAHAAAGVHIELINCAIHPSPLLDIVYIRNGGDTAQDLTGWELRSDGENERMSLTPAGTIGPGQEIAVTAGIHAVNLPDQGTFLWSNNEILRDSGDPPDYVLLFDPAGNQVSGMDCNHNPVAPATAAPTEAPAVTPAPSAAPAAQVRPAAAQGAASRPSTPSGAGQVLSGEPAAPNAVPLGGGPPGADGANALAWLLAGAFLSAAGIATTFAAVRVRPAALANREGRSPRCAK